MALDDRAKAYENEKNENKLDETQVTPITPVAPEVREVNEIKEVKDANDIREIKKEIEELKNRNTKVELNKARETSTFRKVLVAISTYFVIVLFFLAADLPKPFEGAIIPTIGFLLSTLTFPFMRDYRVRSNYKKVEPTYKKVKK